MNKILSICLILFSISLVSAIPTEFDYRDHEGQNWMSPVKSQGICNSCWGFASLGSVEALINLEKQDPNFNVDLSEQLFLTDYEPQLNCGGGKYPYFSLLDGIVDEECLKYESQNSDMSGICGGENGDEWEKRRWKIKDAEDWRVFVEGGVEKTKKELVDQGPLYVNFNIDGSFNSEGIYTNCGSSNPHAAVLVGYNEDENYWIIKNSWGTGWADGGYFKMDMDSCPLKLSPVATAIQQTSTTTYAPDTLDITNGQGTIADIVGKDDSKQINLADEFEVEVEFDLSQYQSADQVYLNLNQKRTNDVSLSISYCQEQYDFTIQESKKIARFNICDSKETCSQISSCTLNLNYQGQENSNLELDWLALEPLYDSDNDSHYDNFDCAPNDPNIHEPNFAYTDWSEWQDFACLEGDVQQQVSYQTKYDLNSCAPNETIAKYQEIQGACDSCTPNLVTTDWTDWEFTTECQNGVRNQTRTRTIYDENLCGEVQNETETEERMVDCDGNPLQCIQNIDCDDGIPETKDSCNNYECSNEFEKVVLKQGWNLLSLPEKVSRTQTEFESKCDYDGTLWKWEEGKYKAIIPGEPLPFHKGIYANLISECEFMVDELPNNEDIELESGWNLIGFPSIVKMNDYKGDCNIQGITSGLNMLETLSGEDLLIPGRGYWVYAVESCTLSHS